MDSCGFVLFYFLYMFPFIQMVTSSNPLLGIYLSLSCHHHYQSTKLPCLLHPILIFLSFVFVKSRKSVVGGLIEKKNLIAYFGLCKCKWPSPFLACSSLSVMGPFLTHLGLWIIIYYFNIATIFWSIAQIYQILNIFVNVR